MFSRVNLLQTTPERLPDVARVVRDVVHPGISGEPGYAGYIVLGNHDTGRALGVTLWESGEAREASDARALQIRPIVEGETGGTMESVERYEVIFYDIPA
jgi:antibiotic biosynthesis monooxygenase